MDDSVQVTRLLLLTEFFMQRISQEGWSLFTN